MSDIARMKYEESMKSGAYANKIRSRLKDVLKGDLPPDIEGLPTDFGDIQEVCNNYLTSIDALLANKHDNKEVIVILDGIRNDLYIHLAYHLKELKKPLNKLINDLEKLEPK